jgi:nicotinate-nucleotide adenylyltransferase
MVPIAVVDRPPDSFRALSSIAAQTLMPYRIDERNAGMLASRRAPAWTFLTGLKSTLSSTRLRNPDGSWKDDGAQ